MQMLHLRFVGKAVNGSRSGHHDLLSLVTGHSTVGRKLDAAANSLGVDL